MQLLDKTWRQGDGLENEDIANHVGTFAWVLDGATALIKNDFYTPRWLVEKADAILAAGAMVCTSLDELCAWYVSRIEADPGHAALPAEARPSFAMALIHVREGVLSYRVFADCSIVVREAGGVTVLTDPHWAAITAPMGEAAFLARPRAAQVEAFLALRKTMNTAAGYWIGTADGAAFAATATQTRDLAAGAEIVLCSDGFERAVTMFHLYEWAQVFDRELDAVMDHLRAVEKAPVVEGKPRPFKKSDDVVALRLRI